jgi:hypothetical protein
MLFSDLCVSRLEIFNFPVERRRLDRGPSPPAEPRQPRNRSLIE